MPDGTEKSGIDDALQVLEECQTSTPKTAKVLFPERFYRPFGSIHAELFEALDDPKLPRVAIAAPRGIGKTSIVTVGFAARKILFRQKHFVVVISNTNAQAKKLTDNLRAELVGNPLISRLYGDIRTPKWSSDAWVTATGTMVWPRGAAQQVRGATYGRYRPDLIILDDFEDTESVQNPESRTKILEWLFGDVFMAINLGFDPKDPHGEHAPEIVAIGSILHEDSSLVKLLEHPSFKRIKMSICTDEYKTNYPDFITQERLDEIIESYKKAGAMGVFAREMMASAVPIGETTFSADWFKYYEEEKEQLWKRKGMLNVVIIDPAKTVKDYSADSAICGVAIDEDRGLLYLRDCVSGRFEPKQLYSEAFSMADRIRASTIAVEVTSLEEFILQPLKDVMAQRGSHYQIVSLKARSGNATTTQYGGGKQGRIAALAPYYRQGLIYHNRNISPKLEAQLLSFPRSRMWDVMDCFAYIIELMDMANVILADGLPFQEAAPWEEDAFAANAPQMDTDRLYAGWMN